MSDMDEAELAAIDIAVVAYRDDGIWQVAELSPRSLESIDSIAKELRRYPGETGALALLAIDEDFVILVRAQGANTRVLLSDITAATDWSLAHDVAELLGLVVDDDDEQAPAGDVTIVADMGFPASELAALLDDFDLYPDEVLSEIADRLGFGPLFDAAVGIAD